MTPAWLFAAALAAPIPPAVIVDQAATAVRQPAPHAGTGMSTLYNLTGAIPGHVFELRRRVLDPGAGIGLHPLVADQAFYVLGGEGVLTSAGRALPMRPGTLAYMRRGDMIAIRQTGAVPLDLIVSYPVTPVAAPASVPRR